jgi:hypothetical protein
MNLTRILSLLLPVAAIAFTAAPAIAAPRSACDTLAMTEIGKALNGKAEIDRSQSGPDERGGDNCVWVGPDKGVILIRIQPVADKNLVARKYKRQLEEAYANGKSPESVAGVGDEAKYRDYVGNVKGGVIVGRKGQMIFTVEGSPARDVLGALANMMLSRV